MVGIAGCGDVLASACCMPKCLQMLPNALDGGVNPLGLRPLLFAYLGQSTRLRPADMPEILTSGTDLCRGILQLHPRYLA